MYITYTITHQLTKFFATSGYENLKQMPYQWLCIPIIEITTIGYVIETLGNIKKTLKYLSKSLSVSVTDKLA